MALADLLWTCPECGTGHPLGPGDRHSWACPACDVRFRRDRGASIRATYADGRTIVRTAAEWVDRLPSPGDLLDAAEQGGPGDRGHPRTPVRTARVETRWVTGTDVVRSDHRFLNRVEVFGDVAPGTLRLDPLALTCAPDGGGAETWPLERVAAVQVSSRDLQVKTRGRPLTSFRFVDDSLFLWELLLQEALRRHYRARGKGEILEFQPRIVTAAERPLGANEAGMGGGVDRV